MEMGHKIGHIPEIAIGLAWGTATLSFLYRTFAGLPRWPPSRGGPRWAEQFQARKPIATCLRTAAKQKWFRCGSS